MHRVSNVNSPTTQTLRLLNRMAGATISSVGVAGECIPYDQNSSSLHVAFVALMHLHTNAQQRYYSGAGYSRS